MARWKARGRLYIRRNWTFFAISYGWDVMSGNRSKLAFFEGVWVTLNADFRGKGASPTNHFWYQSSRVIALSCGIKISAVHHLVLSQCTRVTDGPTDGRTDGQNYDSQDRPRICLRGKNAHSVHVITKWWWKGVGVGQEEMTENYVKLVIAPLVCQKIMPNTVGESQEISFLILSGNYV